MSENVLLVFSMPPEGMDLAEYSEWYEGHLKDALTVDGYAAARRFTLAPIRGDTRGETRGETSPTMYPHLAIYVIDGDAREALARLEGEIEAGTIRVPDWLEGVRITSFFGTPLEGPIDLGRLDHCYLVFSTPPASMAADDFIEWYHTHARENLTADGFDAVWRYRLEPDVVDPLAPSTAVHAALYEVHGELPALHAALREAADAGRVGFPEWFGEILFASLDGHAASAPLVALRA